MLFAAENVDIGAMLQSPMFAQMSVFIFLTMFDELCLHDAG